MRGNLACAVIVWCRAELVDLSATSDSGISMSHRRVFGRRMWVELPALLPWFCGGAVRA
jgi:hypothetical protein